MSEVSKMTTTPRAAAMNPTKFNIEAIAKLEHEALQRRTLTERLSDLSGTAPHSFETIKSASLAGFSRS
jgi:hypothetical protein